ncbi:MAG TPA: HAMP domain-containing sensor histidine kinase [Coleofasciculaceae cyanobacterium]
MMYNKQMTLLAKRAEAFLAGLKKTPDSAEYKAWRHRFLLERLHWLVWIGLIACPTFLILNLFIRGVVNASGNPNYVVTPEAVFFSVMTYIAAELSLLLCLILLKIPWARRYPKQLFLGCSWSLTLLGQIQGTLRGEVNADYLSWSLVFPAQATLMPVCWTLHLVSQLGSLSYYFITNLFFGLGNPKIEYPVVNNVIICVVYFWVCFICNLGVYVYERLQRSEFESKRQLQVFLHGVSHDLRNPVTGMLMLLQHLHNRPEEPVSVSHSILERMIQGSDRQLQLINSLLEAHASEVQGVVIHPEPIQLSQLVRSSLADIEPLLTQNQAILKNLIPEDLPRVSADPTQLWRVFTNLINNALKHNPPGLTLTISAVVEPHMIRCCVEDNGEGMLPEQCDRLFDLYFRSSHVRNSLSLGLGLYLCRQIITAHGGEIGVVSSPGAGSKFWFTLPIANPD